MKDISNQELNLLKKRVQEAPINCSPPWKSMFHAFTAFLLLDSSREKDISIQDESSIEETNSRWRKFVKIMQSLENPRKRRRRDEEEALGTSSAAVGTTLKGHEVLVMKRRLFYSDVNKSQGHLAIPKSQLISEFLTAKEDMKLENDRTHARIPAKLIDPRSVEHDVDIKLQFVGLNGSRTYTIPKPWNDIVEQNKLYIGANVQLWASRRNGNELYLNLIVESSKDLGIVKKKVAENNEEPRAKRRRSQSQRKKKDDFSLVNSGLFLGEQTIQKEVEGDTLPKEYQVIEIEKLRDDIKDLRRDVWKL